MDSQLSNVLPIIACLQESARRGDWKTAGAMAAILPLQALTVNGEDLGEYLRCLKEALIAAKVSRAHSAESLAAFNAAAFRLNAAARFNDTRAGFAALRQEFGEMADS
jgi:hypothetical protein